MSHGTRSPVPCLGGSAMDGPEGHPYARTDEPEPAICVSPPGRLGSFKGSASWEKIRGPGGRMFPSSHSPMGSAAAVRWDDVCHTGQAKPRRPAWIFLYAPYDPSSMFIGSPFRAGCVKTI